MFTSAAYHVQLEAAPQANQFRQDTHQPQAHSLFHRALLHSLLPQERLYPQQIGSSLVSDSNTSKIRSYDQVLIDIVKYVYHYTINEPESFRRARVLLLDSLGCAMESLDEVSVRRIIGPPVPETMVPDGFRLPGTNIQIDPVKGAFDMATLIRYLDHSDALGGVEWGHPSDNLGAIIAVMDWLSRSTHGGKLSHSGPELNVHTLLIAMIKAYGIQGCFQVANSF